MKYILMLLALICFCISLYKNLTAPEYNDLSLLILGWVIFGVAVLLQKLDK